MPARSLHPPAPHRTARTAPHRSIASHRITAPPLLPTAPEPQPQRYTLTRHAAALHSTQHTRSRHGPHREAPSPYVARRLEAPQQLTATAGLELYRLEQRYTRREKRSTFISEARYVDGEYVYTASPSSSTKSAATTTSTSSRRFSKMPSMTAVRVKELARAGTGRS